MSTYDLVDLGKFHTGHKSDRAFALSIGLTSQNITDWKSGKAFPSDANLRRLAKAANLTFMEAMEVAMDEELAVPVMTKAEFIDAVSNGSYIGGPVNIREKDENEISMSIARRSSGKGSLNIKTFKKAGFANVYLLGGISAVSLALASHLPYELVTAGLLGANAVYYVKSIT